MKLTKNSKIFIGIVIILVIVIGFKVFSSRPSANNSPLSAEDSASVNSNTSAPTTETDTNQIKSLDVPTPSTAYTSKSDNFAVNFPTVPKVESTTYKSSSAGAIPLTEYTEEYAKGLERAWYKVAVYHFPASYQFSDSFLNDSADVYVGSVSAMHPGSRVTSHQKTQFLGNPAISGVVTVPVKLGIRSTTTTDTNNYALMTVKDQNLYIISTYGTTQDNYTAFINSFKFQ